MEFDLSAAIWRKGLTDEKAFIAALAERLSQALPGKVRVEKKKKLFSKDGYVSLIEVVFEDEHFIIQFHPQHGVTAEKAKVVREVRLKSDRVELDEWLSALSAEIEGYAEKHRDIRSSLERFLLN
ncbi:hypothetical protein PU629_13490 [Pullulanibacillus sp. KACC 23026]|uniref:hypothetical protein n=1 Tax=Pullulanibacillus sp. KACC 23026 TaxID=3028315 RepID=UPI0023AF73EB|nr:hypothetical protein [Pullulanibacillus sp. KACC 23026]WEG11180.1 hypothetical protein PU629_13490 [Pullulanibacillus sp. KACC 23026]